jgi:hypothetical protein
MTAMPMDYNIAVPQFNVAPAQVGGPVNMLTDVMKLKGLQQDQQLNQLKFQEYQRARAQAAADLAEKNANKQALVNAMRAASVGDTGPRTPDMLAAANALIGQGRLPAALTALGASEAFTKDTKAKSDLAKIDIENLDKEFKTFSTFSRQVRSPEDAGVYAEAMYDHPTIGKLMQRTGLTKEQAIAKAQQDYAADPVRWVASHVDLTGQQAVDTLKQTTTNTDMGGQMLQQQRDAFGRPIEGGETRLAKTPVPKAPGEMETPEAKLDFERKKLEQRSQFDLEKAYPVKKASIDATSGDIDAQIARAKALKEHAGLGGITGGVFGRVGSVTAASTSAQADLNQLKSKAGFEALQSMRDRSPTGGALGNVSDAEGRRLESSAAALDQAQSKDDFKIKLDRYIEDLERSKKALKNAFDTQYGSVKPKTAPAKSDGWTIEEH